MIPGAHGNPRWEGGASFHLHVCHHHPGHRTGLPGDLTPQTSTAKLGLGSGNPVSFAVPTVAVKFLTSLFPKMEIWPCLSVWDMWKFGSAGVSFRAYPAMIVMNMKRSRNKGCRCMKMGPLEHPQTHMCLHWLLQTLKVLQRPQVLKWNHRGLTSFVSVTWYLSILQTGVYIVF